jgi:transcriptional regulator with XRE-family HTH domain
VKFNYAKLLGRMREFNHTQESLAKAIGKNESTLSAKLNIKSYFTTAEICAICEVLEIPFKDIPKYFFTV